uniref:Reverse transcriptase Ty1/copia-type domain-containing protein n=1 Tax=Solanum lycopersicum TaxID=4081 RepID=A0A3Q7GLW6_SOLLC
MDSVLTLLHHASAPLKFRSLTFQSAIYLINRLPTPLLATKLDAKSNPCVFIGYSAATNSYVVFVEHTFPFTTNYPQFSRPQVSHMEKWLCPDDHSNVSPQPNPETPSNQIVTRSQNNIFKPKAVFDYLATSIVKHLPLTPNTFSQASLFPEWKAAMTKKHIALLKNKTWSLVPSTPSQNVVGTILVEKGFHQLRGIEFHSTFSPVIKITTTRLIFSLYVSLKWSLQQPPEFVDPRFPINVFKLHKSIYGLCHVDDIDFTVSIKDLGLLHFF